MERTHRGRKTHHRNRSIGPSPLSKVSCSGEDMAQTEKRCPFLHKQGHPGLLPLIQAAVIASGVFRTYFLYGWFETIRYICAALVCTCASKQDFSECLIASTVSGFFLPHSAFDFVLITCKPVRKAMYEIAHALNGGFLKPTMHCEKVELDRKKYVY